LGFPRKHPQKPLIHEYTQFSLVPRWQKKRPKDYDLKELGGNPFLEEQSIKETLALWKNLEVNNPDLADNWRWRH